MTNNFEKSFDGFLTERMGEDVARLREKNERYRNALTEYSELVRQNKIGKMDDYEGAFKRLAELDEYIRDLETRYLYYAGMLVYKKIGDAVSSFDSLEMFNE